MNIIWGILWGLAAQVVTFIQLQGQLKYQWMKDYTWVVVLMGIPISFMFMQSVKYFVEGFDGQIWPSRLIGFGIGVIVFTLMSELLFKEPFTAKTGVCLFLGLCIIAIQVFWK
jgi:ABC-type enterochelin transport system permease subunit